MTLKAIPLDKVWTKKDLDSYVKENIGAKMDPILKGEKVPPPGVNKDVLWTLSINLLRMVKQQEDQTGKRETENNGGSTDAILKELAAMKESMAAIPQMIQKAIDDREVAAKPPSPKKTPKKYNLKLEKVGMDQWEVVKPKIRKKLESIPVDGTSSSAEDTSLVFKDKTHRDKAEELLKAEFDTTTTTVTSKKLNPKVTISDIAAEITTAQEVYEELLRKNMKIREQVETHQEELKVIFLHKESRYAVVQMSKKIRDIIREKNDRVNLDFQIHVVKDRFHVIQCYRCQRFGHKADSPLCPKKDSDEAVCSFCSGNHRYKDCQLRKDHKTDSKCCANCKTSRSKVDQLNATSHTAGSFQCPFYIMEKERIMGRTAGAEKLKNEYSLKARDFLARRRTH